MECVNVTFHLPNGSHVGPYLCRISADSHDRTSPPGGLAVREKNLEAMAEQINTLLALPPQRMADSVWWFQPPALPGEFVLVLVRRDFTPEVQDCSKNLRASANAASVDYDVYVVEISSDEAASGLSLGMIKRYVCEVFGDNALSEDSLQPCKPSIVNGNPEVYYSGSILVGNAPSQKPIKPSENQPVVKPAEESPHNSFDSQCRLVGKAEAFVPSPSVVSSDPPEVGKEETEPQTNALFLHSRGEDKVEVKNKAGVEDEATLVSITSCGEELDSTKGIYKKSQSVDDRRCSTQQSADKQGYVTGRTPLKLLMQTPPDINIGQHDVTQTDPDEEYRSLQAESFQSAKEVEECSRKVGKESVSFPGACKKRCLSTKKDVRWPVNFENERANREKESNVASLGQEEVSLNQEEEEEKVFLSQDREDFKEFQDKVHILEHVYNGECFLKNQCIKPLTSESYKEMEEMARAHREGTLGTEATELFKRYINAHCQRCSDIDCRVPHMAAGCPQPGVPFNMELNFIKNTDNQPSVHANNETSSSQNPTHQQPDQCQKLTDGHRVFAQATDDHPPGQHNMVYVYGVPRQTSNKSSSSADSSVKNRAVHAQASEEEKKELQREEMKNGHFPSVDVCRCQLDSLVKKLIYCAEELFECTGFSFGSCVANSLQIYHRLGKGGNGTVFLCSLNRCQLAAKFTRYRERELRIWSSLNHENVIALSGVVLVRPDLDHNDVHVYQLMPLMTSTLQEEVKKVDNLQNRIRSKELPSYPLLANIYHIFKELVKGVCYLHRNLIYHGDIKGSNILIQKHPSCQCYSALLCTCPPELKCSVRISDFDTADYFTPGHDGDVVSNMIKVLHSGTMFYRSSEAHVGCRGPWSDIWSVGCVVLYMLMGHPRIPEAYRDKGHSALHHYYPLLVLMMETVYAHKLLVNLNHLCSDTPELRRLARIISATLNLDFHKRITAGELQNELLCL